MANKKMFIDVTKCTACRGCQTACKNWNNLPAEIKAFKGNLQTHKDLSTKTYTIVTMEERGAGKDFKWLFRKHQCLHCSEAACIKVCPQDALKHSKSGAVVRNYNKCIGCEYCAANCPFQVPKIDKSAEKMFKCTQCFDRVENGMLPACAKTCPTSAIVFGDGEEMLELAAARLNEVKKEHPEANLYGTDFLEGTNTFYLLDQAPSAYGLPKNPSIPLSATIWKDIVQPIGKFLPLGAVGAILTSFAFTKLVSGKDEDNTRDGKGGMNHGE